jgi:hypothetical protein
VMYTLLVEYQGFMKSLIASLLPTHKFVTTFITISVGHASFTNNAQSLLCGMGRHVDARSMCQRFVPAFSTCLPPKQKSFTPMFGENWRLVYCEPVPLGK